MTEELTVVPTSPEDRKAIHDAIVEASNARTQIDAQRDHIRDIAKNIKEKVGIKPRVFNKLVTAYHKQNYHEVTQTNDEFETLYETVMKTEAS